MRIQRANVPPVVFPLVSRYVLMEYSVSRVDRIHLNPLSSLQPAEHKSVLNQLPFVSDQSLAKTEARIVELHFTSSLHTVRSRPDEERTCDDRRLRLSFAALTIAMLVPKPRHSYQSLGQTLRDRTIGDWLPRRLPSPMHAETNREFAFGGTRASNPHEGRQVRRRANRTRHRNPHGLLRSLQFGRPCPLCWRRGGHMDRAHAVYFPLASNAHSLLTGAALEGVRRRLKLSSLLYDQVFLESGSMQIQAGPTGAMVWRGSGRDPDATWQTPGHRSNLQGAEFSLSLGPSGAPPGSEEMHVALRSESAIAWAPTFEPFRLELPKSADWIQFGQFQTLSPDEKRIVETWRRHDDNNAEIARRLPDGLVRGRVVSSVEDDLAVAVAHGVSMSLDRLHATVLTSRLADPRLTVRGFALPILVPGAGQLDWSTIAGLRKHRALQSLRAVLDEMEQEVLSEADRVGEVVTSVHRKYQTKLEALALDMPTVSRTIGVGLAEIALGGVIGFCTLGISWLGIAAGAAPGAALTAAEAVALFRGRRSRRWVSAMQSLGTPQN